VLMLKFTNVLLDFEEQADTAAFQTAMDINHFRQSIREAEQEHSVVYDPPSVKEAAKSIASSMKHRGMCAYVIYIIIC